MTDPSSPAFDAPDLVRQVERLPHAAIDALPFGAIRLDTGGHVQFYSQREAELSGYGRPIGQLDRIARGAIDKALADNIRSGRLARGDFGFSSPESLQPLLAQHSQGPDSCPPLARSASAS